MAISEETKRVARIVLRGMELREQSYDHIAADNASKEHEEAIKEHIRNRPNELYYGMVDYSKFYKLSLNEALDQAAADEGMPGLGRILYLAVEAWWNDAADWAHQILDPTAVCEPTHLTCQHNVPYRTSSLDKTEDYIGCDQCRQLFLRLKDSSPGGN